mmetsp:Transcript_4496/g.6375  ORF Transcript_4496/g.6375 Transcript_4496/m.6375 type:complete len:100 (-) Transcript_4496:1245-1544(-)
MPYFREFYSSFLFLWVACIIEGIAEVSERSAEAKETLSFCVLSSSTAPREDSDNSERDELIPLRTDRFDSGLKAPELDKRILEMRDLSGELLVDRVSEL